MFATLFLSAALLGAVTVPPIALQPLGDVDPDVVSRLAQRLQASFGTAVAVLPAAPLPDSAWYEPRRRYRADKLVSFLDRAAAGDIAHVVGVTSRDISVTNGRVPDWGVFGVAELSGRHGVVSTYRLRAHGASDELFRSRLERVAAHELGHTFGLPHCARRGCLMQDADGGIGPVDLSTGRLCDACVARLAEALRPGSAAARTETSYETNIASP